MALDISTCLSLKASGCSSYAISTEASPIVCKRVSFNIAMPYNFGAGPAQFHHTGWFTVISATKCIPESCNMNHQSTGLCFFNQFSKE